MVKTTTVVEREPEVESYDEGAVAVLADTGVRFEANIMGTCDLGFSYHIKATGYRSEGEADAFLRRQAESWEEQGVTPRSQDRPKAYGGNGAAKAAGGAVFSPGAAPVVAIGDNICDNPSCGGTIGNWTKDDGTTLTGAQMKASAHRRGQQKYCFTCHKSGLR